MSTGLIPDQQQSTAMSLIAEAVANKVDIDTLNKLLDFKLRLDSIAQQSAYAKAMAECEKEMPSVAKDRQNTHTKSWYATLDSINEKIKPIYAKHGFSLSFCESPSDQPNTINVTATLRHRDGHSEQFSGSFPVDGGGMKGGANKTDIQAKGSTLTYARRYLTLMIFNIAIEGEDTDGNKPKQTETLTPEQVATITELIERCAQAGKPVLMPTFLEWFGVAKDGSISQIPRINYSNAVKSLNDKLAAAKAESGNAS